MKMRFATQMAAWVACLAAITAFSRPASNTGGRLAHALRASATKAGCDKCEDVGNNHAFDGSGAMFDCMACNACHANFQSGWCQNFHCACGGETHDAALLQHQNALLTPSKIADVAASSNWRVVAAFLADNVDRAQYNADRHVLQLLSCDGTVQAQYPLSDAVASALQ